MAARLLPIFLKMEDRPCLVVGAGTVAESKIETLLSGGARISVVAPDATPGIEETAAAGKIRWLRRPFEPADLEGNFMVIAATSNVEVNQAVFKESQQRGILCNATDDPSHCDFYFSAVVQRGDLQIAVSTAGKSPAFAQRLKEELNQALDESLGEQLSDLGECRRRILETHPPSSDRARLLHLLAYRETSESIDTNSPTTGAEESTEPAKPRSTNGSDWE